MNMEELILLVENHGGKIRVILMVSNVSQTIFWVMEKGDTWMQRGNLFLYICHIFIECTLAAPGWGQREDSGLQNAHEQCICHILKS